jgi:Verrucomicrobium spinosum paralogous family TIGR02596
MELLVVLAILGLLAALAAPALVGSLSGTRLTTAGQSVQDALALARQTAVSRGATVEVRWYKFAGSHGGAPRYRAMQTFLLLSGTAKPLDRGLPLPSGVMLSEIPERSPFLHSSNHPETPVPAGESHPGRGADTRYRAFRFSPRGAVDLAAGENHFTLVPERESEEEPGANFVTLQIQPISGGVREFRP